MKPSYIEPIKECYDICKTKWPTLAKVCEIKRYVPPFGYLNPKYFTPVLMSQLMYGINKDDNLSASISGSVTYSLLNNQMPVYFVGENFLRAIAATELPNNLLIKDVKWPLPSILFVLPYEFIHQYCGSYVPFLALSNIQDRFISPKFEWPFKTPKKDVFIDGPRYCSYYPVFLDGKVPIDYCSTFVHKTPVSEAIANEIFTDHIVIPEARGFIDPNDAKALGNKINNLAFKLLMAMSICPEVIEHGELDRPARMKHGKVEKDALWHPNFIGRQYRIQYFRHQRYGVQLLKSNLIWIQPVLVNADKALDESLTK